MSSDTTPEWLHLGADEEIVWEGRPHPIDMGISLPIGIVLFLIGMALAGWGGSDADIVISFVGVAVAVAGGVIALVQYAFWTNTRYVITSSELYKKRGVISRDVVQFRLDRVQNTSLQQDVLGRVLKYGDLTVYTAGSGEPELTFERVPYPSRASARLNEQLEASNNPRTNRGGVRGNE